MAELNLDLGNIDVALAESGQAVALEPRDPIVRLTRAKVLATAGRRLEALEEMRLVRGLEGVAPKVLEQIDALEARLKR